MPMLPKILLPAGAALIAAGLLLWFFQDKIQLLGRLPGDIRVERENFRFYFPITTMLLLSVAMSLMLWVIRWFRNLM